MADTCAMYINSIVAVISSFTNKISLQSYSPT